MKSLNHLPRMSVGLHSGVIGRLQIVSGISGISRLEIADLVRSPTQDLIQDVKSIVTSELEDEA